MKYKTGSIAIVLAAVLAICVPVSNAQTSAGQESAAQAAGAQSSDTQTTAAQDAQSSQYSGVSHPPSDDEIVATPDVPATKPAMPVQKPAAAAPVVYALPAPFNTQDADLVTSVDQPSATQLQRRDAEADTDLVTSLPSKPGELAEGTNLKVRLLASLSTTETQTGEAFAGLVTNDVTESGKVVVPMGSELRGRVMFVRAGTKLGGHATLHLRPDMLILPDGSRYVLHAQVVGTQGSDTRTDVEGGIEPKSHLKKNTLEYGAAAGSGAIVGAEVAGGVGALVGAGIGAGLVTTHLLLQDHQAELPKNSVVVFGLTEPMTLTSIQN